MKLEKHALGAKFTTFIYVMIFANLAVMAHERPDVGESNAETSVVACVVRVTSLPPAPPPFLTPLSLVADMQMEFLNNPPDAQGEVTSNKELLKYLNYFFAAIFAYEFFVKIFGMAPKFYFRDPFNCFDTFLVLFSALEIFILPLLFPAPEEEAVVAEDDAAAAEGSEDGGSGGSGAGGLKVVRILKMARLLKMLRLAKILKAIKLKVNRHLKRVEEMYNADDYDWPEWRRKLKKWVTSNGVTNFIYVLIFINLGGGEQQLGEEERKVKEGRLPLEASTYHRI